MAILTVGVGQQYKTIAAAVAAAKAGDTVQIKPGTYVNDFPGLVSNITIEAVGGMAKLVATVSPPNRKAWFVTSGNVTLANLDVSGVKVADLNGAAIRYQGGNLTVINSYFHNNQEGILAGDDPNGSVTIKNSEIAYNGSNGYSHNVYINNVGTTIVDNSYIHDVLGHGSEFRSRGANTIITNSRIVDNKYADNYTVDLPAGGNVVISNTIIQKAAGATNPIMVHFAPDSVVPWHAGSNITITNSTFINNYGSKGWGVYLSSSATATLTGNTSYGLTTSHFVSGAATVSGTVFTGALPAISKAAPWVATGAVLPDSTSTSTSSSSQSNQDGDAQGGVAPAVTSDLTASNAAVGSPLSGGVGDDASTTVNAVKMSALFQIADTSSVTADSALSSADDDSGSVAPADPTPVSDPLLVQTDPNAATPVTLGDADAVVTSLGQDTIFAGAGAATVNVGSPAPAAGEIANGPAAGAATVYGGSGPLTLEAQGSSGLAFIGASGDAAVMSDAGDLNVVAGSGNLTLTGGSGGLSFVGGGGNALINEGSGDATIQFGAGDTTVTGGGGATLYQFVAGSGGGNDLLNGFDPARDQLSFVGFSGDAIQSETTANGSAYVNLVDGTSIVLANVVIRPATS